MARTLVTFANEVTRCSLLGHKDEGDGGEVSSWESERDVSFEKKNDSKHLEFPGV